jgi:hypothetical protein
VELICGHTSSPPLFHFSPILGHFFMDDHVHILPFGSQWSNPGVVFLSPNLFSLIDSKSDEKDSEKDAEKGKETDLSPTKIISKLSTKNGHAFFCSRRLKLDFFSTGRRECVLHPWTSAFCKESKEEDVNARISTFHISKQFIHPLKLTVCEYFLGIACFHRRVMTI